MTTPKASMGTQKIFRDIDDLQLYSRADLCNRPGVTEAQAVTNRAIGRGPVRPRPARQGLISVSEATLDRWVADKEFPAPIKIGPRAVRWRGIDIRGHYERASAVFPKASKSQA